VLASVLLYHLTARFVLRSKRKLARARERRATLILGIVMASFIGCWLPFFSIYPLSLLFDLDVPGGLFAVIFCMPFVVT